MAEKFQLREPTDPQERAWVYFVSENFEARARIRKAVLAAAIQGRTPATCPTCIAGAHPAPRVNA